MRIEPQEHIKRYVNVEIPTRDGCLLRADLYMPVGAGPFPAIIMRSPYLKSMAATPHYSQWGKYYAQNGFVFVMCDVRGRGDSEGVFKPFFHETTDGYDTIEWVAAQSWCTGEIGMDGNSYNAHTAWMAALSGTPHLKAMTVSGVPGDLYRHGTQYLNGIKTLYLVLWMFMTSGRNMQIPLEVYSLEKPYEFLPDLLKRCLAVPVGQIPEILGFDGKNWIEALQHAADDGFWDETKLESRLVGSSVAALHITGWFDNYLVGTVAGFEALRQEGARPDCQHLIIGPWTHNANVAPVQKVGDLDFGEQALLDMLALKVRFFNHHLKHTGEFHQPAVQVFDMGSLMWNTANDFPDTYWVSHYLSNLGISANQGESTWLVYDPRNPTPSGVYVTPANIDGIDQRSDVLHFKSAAISTPMTLAGQTQLKLSIEQDAPESDLIVTLCDRYPDGRLLPLSFSGQKIHTNPGVNLTIEIDFPYVLHTFQTGHRIELLIQHAAIPLLVPLRHPVKTVLFCQSSILLPIKS